MALTVDGIFSLMPELFLAEKAQGLTVSVYYQVTGEGGGDYACLIENGAFTLKREAKPDATSVVVIGADAAELIASLSWRGISGFPLSHPPQAE